MMDRLDQVVDIAGPLLRHVDELLTAAGAPAGHSVWAQLRRVRLLPADAVYGVAALRPAALAEAAPELRSQARAHALIAASLPSSGDWTGEAADAYDTARRRFADHLDGDPEGLAERLDASADLGDALMDWMRQSRGELAVTLAEVLGSVQAVVLAGAAGDATGAPADGTPGVPEADVVVAAADIAARVLRTVADGQDRGAELLDGSGDLTAARPSPAGGYADRG